MTTIDRSLLTLLFDGGLLREGHFAFRSGRHSAGLLNRDLLLADPMLASRLGYNLAKRFFTDHIDTVAAPSIWGAGLAQWVGYYLEPNAKVVYATPQPGGRLEIADYLIDHIAGKRVLIVDNLVMTGETVAQFTRTIDALGATVLGIGALWNASVDTVDGHPITGVLNGAYDAYLPGECPICRNDGPDAEQVPY
jgi:orotate phosphoribosyltransferase